MKETTKSKSKSGKEIDKTKNRWLGYFDDPDNERLVNFKENHRISNTRTLEILVRIGLKHQTDYKQI